MTAPSAAPLLAIRGLRAAYGKIEALKGVDLDIKTGEIVALIGANGAGKSTLMMSVFGRPRARAGTIEFDGRDITFEPTHHVARLRIAQSPEGRRIFPRMTVAENLRMGADAAVESSEAERKKVSGTSLSGGEQQMLAIGRALLTNPRLLIMDEPSEGLAPTIVEGLIQTIKDLAAAGMGLLVVEQNLGVATTLADRQLVMVAGSIATETTAKELLADPAAQRRFLGVEPLADAA